MARLYNLLAQQLEDVQEQLTLEQEEINYTPHKKYEKEERKYTRTHIDRKKLDYDRTKLHMIRRNKRQSKWKEVY